MGSQPQVARGWPRTLRPCDLRVVSSVGTDDKCNRIAAARFVGAVCLEVLSRLNARLMFGVSGARIVHFDAGFRYFARDFPAAFAYLRTEATTGRRRHSAEYSGPAVFFQGMSGIYAESAA